MIYANPTEHLRCMQHRTRDMKHGTIRMEGEIEDPEFRALAAHAQVALRAMEERIEKIIRNNKEQAA